MATRLQLDTLKKLAITGSAKPTACFCEDVDTLTPFLTEWRGKYKGSTPLLLQPHTTEAVAAILAYANTEGLKIKTQGGNTGLVGGSTPGLEGRSEILLSTRNLKGEITIDTQAACLTAGAGHTVQEIQTAAKDAGLLFPLSLASEGSCTVGGTIATNAGGMHVIRYGTMGKLTAGIEAVLADGRLINTLSPLVKDNSGYHLTGLFAGSEGTLGVITKACLRLYPQETVKETLWLGTDSLQSALNILNSAKARFGPLLSVFEVISHGALGFALTHIAGRAPITTPADWYILLELGAADTSTALRTQAFDWAQENIDNGLIIDAAVAESLQNRQDFWRLRESLSEAQKREGISIKHDISLPLAQIPEFHEAATRLLSEKYPGARPTPFGHLGDGNLHYNVMQPADSSGADFARLWEDMNHDIHTLTTRFGGSISAEHGIGTLKKAALKTAKPAPELTVMKQIKQALDPKNTLNPGIIFD